MIMHHDKVITDPYDVANIMNDFYINIANQIGDDSKMPNIAYMSLHEFVEKCCAYHASHPSIMNIRAHTPADFHFDFYPVQPPYMSLTCFLLKVQTTTSGIKIAYSYIQEQIMACILLGTLVLNYGMTCHIMLNQ